MCKICTRGGVRSTISIDNNDVYTSNKGAGARILRTQDGDNKSDWTDIRVAYGGEKSLPNPVAFSRSGV